MSIRRLLGSLGLATCLGCSTATSVPIRIGVTPAVPATLSLRTVAGAPPTSPNRCTTPCALTFPTTGGQELTLKAPGFYPAVVYLPGSSAWLFSQQNSDGMIVIPMVQHTSHSGTTQ